MLRQADRAAETYRQQAMAASDQWFGVGYAPGHAALVAAVMPVAAQDFDTTMPCR